MAPEDVGDVARGRGLLRVDALGATRAALPLPFRAVLLQLGCAFSVGREANRGAPVRGNADRGNAGRAPAAEGLRPAAVRQRPRSLMIFATWPVAFTLYSARSTLPSSSTTTVERMTPVTVLP